ncbi:hypothetical protein [Streptomyces sp. GSL17-111]|uniref:hypothetical protein n=1 Tax=Streptomyces sp. GSL17-111 TaxID=3121596 RepID=UPI0030F45B1A
MPTRSTRRSGAAVVDGAPGDVERVAAELSRDYRRLPEDAFGRLRLPAEPAGELTDRFGDFMRYLAVANLLQHRAWSCLPVLVRTVDQDYPLPAGSRAIRLDHTARGPLGDPVAARVVSAALRPIGADR